MKIVLKGKNALVGGSSGGIGKAIAEQLAASGASVFLMARNEQKLREIVNNLPVTDGQNHGYLLVDFNDFESFKTQINLFFDSHTIDILINNTQGPKPGGALEKSIDDYQEAFNLLFKTVCYTTELALKHMKDQQWGRVINVASVSVKEPLSYLTLSNSIRAAVVTWAKTLATDLGTYAITVNSILTGYFDTERIQQLNESKAKSFNVPVAEVREEMLSKVPLKRFGDPKEYGYLVSFLASEQAAFITGTNIPIDGGLLRAL